MLFGLKQLIEPAPQPHSSISLLSEAIEALHQKIHHFTHVDAQDLNHKLSLLEQEITASLHHLSDILSSQVASLPDLERAIQIGLFRKQFHDLNTAYGRLKSKLLKKPCDEHLCCMCHFSPIKREGKPINNNIIDMHEGRILNPSPTEQSTLSMLVFTCGGGQGHISATKSLGQNAYNKFHMLVADTLEDTLAPSDLLKKIHLNFSHEKLYNYLLKHEKFKLLKLVTSGGSIFYSMQQKKIEQLIRLEVLKQKPNMLISCIPLMNSMILNIAKEFNLPLIIVSTDLDTKEFIKGMNPRSCDLNYPHYRLALAYEDPDMRAIAEKVLPKDKIHVTGFPVRAPFNEEFSDEKIVKMRQKYGVDKKDRVVLIMMGGNAGLVIEQYAEILATITEEEFTTLDTTNTPITVICLCGNPKVAADQKMCERINQLAAKCQSIQIKGIPSSPEVAELMSISDVIITKPGGCTTNEALIKKLPMIFHAPFALMEWEVFNMQFSIKNHMGQRFKLQTHGLHQSSHEIHRNKLRLLPLLKNALKRKEELRKGSDSLERKHFPTEFIKLTNQLLKDAENR
jgi:processive 1,2-diacylglycerol beta-glucosyltransferase